MNVTIVNALGRHSKISTGNEITHSTDVTLPINSDFLNNYDSSLNSKQLQLRTLAEEETNLNQMHNDMSRKLNQLRQDEQALNQEAERLHRLIVSRRIPIFDQPTNEDDNNNNQEQIFPNFNNTNGFPHNNSNNNNNGFHNIDTRPHFGDPQNSNNNNNNNNNNNHFSNPFQVAISNNNNLGFHNNNNNNNNGFHKTDTRPHFGDIQEAEVDDELFEI
jgi:hypothetical protein